MTPNLRQIFSDQEDAAKATLAKNLVLARSAKGITQDTLAEAAGISRTTIARIEGGEGDPRLSTIVDSATALDISPILLLLGEEELGALVQIVKEAPHKAFANRLSAAEVEQMRRLLQSGMEKNRVRAAKIGMAAAQAAGFTGAGALVGASIASALLPGIGIVLGAALGSLLTKPGKKMKSTKD